jgi:hypothetical protein
LFRLEEEEKKPSRSLHHRNMSSEKSTSGEESTETVKHGTEGTVGELSTQNQTGGTAGQTGSGTGTAGQTLPTATAESSMTATSSKYSF